MIGQTLGHFRLEARIGAGGMGEVYRAVDLDLGRRVAIKVLPPNVLGDPGRRQRLLREAQAASALNHPGIVTIHEIGTTGEIDYIAMELLEGTPLDEALPRTGVELDKALDWTIQAAEALTTAHGRSIVHRDLKPANLFLTAEGRVKLLDFGLAKLVQARASDESLHERTTAEALTAPGSVVGTASYMSPEQARGEAVDSRSDLFSLGCVLHALLTGRSPFERGSLAETLGAILQSEPPSLASLRPGLPPEVARVVGTALEKDVRRRYQSAADLLADLRALRQPPHPQAPGAPVPHGPRHRPRLLAALLALAASAAGTAGWFLAQRRDPGPVRFELLSTFPGSHRDPTLSPDGAFVAFVRDDAKDVPQIWVKDLAGGDPRQITSLERPAHRPRWSAKNDRIVFHSAGRLWAIPPLGGTPRPLVEGANPALSADGARLVFERDDEIWTAGADGQDARPLAGAPRTFFRVDRSPAFSPDGRQVVYFHPESGPAGDLWLIDAEGGVPRRLTHDVAPGGWPVFTPDGRSIIHASRRSGGMTLWRQPVSGGAPAPVTTGSGEDTQPDVSADGRHLVYVNARNAFSVAWFDPGSGERRVLVENRTGLALAELSADGAWAAYFAPAAGSEHIFAVPVDGGEPRQLTFGSGEENIAPTWSHDGAWLFYFRVRPEPSFRRVPAAGGESETVVDGWRWGERYRAAVDPTGSRIAVTVWERQRHKETRLHERATGHEIVLPIPLGGPTWSRDGQGLAGVHDGRLLVCSKDGAGCRPVAERVVFYPRWSGDGRFLYFLRLVQPVRPLVRELWRVTRDGRREERLAELDGYSSLRFGYGVSPAGAVVWTRFQPGRQELWIAELR